jgi:hypothetical protein
MSTLEDGGGLFLAFLGFLFLLTVAGVALARLARACRPRGGQRPGESRVLREARQIAARRWPG